VNTLFIQNHVVQKIATAAAVLRRQAGVQQPGGARFSENIAWENTVGFPASDVRLDLAAQKATHGVAELLVLFAEDFP
jgi:hypothetical protein